MFWEKKSAKKRRKSSHHFYVIFILHAFIDKKSQQMSMCEIKGFRKKLPPPPPKKKKINKYKCKKEMSGPGDIFAYKKKKKLQSKNWTLSQLLMYSFIHYTINTSLLQKNPLSHKDATFHTMFATVSVWQECRNLFTCRPLVSMLKEVLIVPCTILDNRCTNYCAIE